MFGRIGKCKSHPCEIKFDLELPLDCLVITKATAVSELLENNVVVDIGYEEIWFARNLPLDVAWVRIMYRLRSGSQLI